MSDVKPAFRVDQHSVSAQEFYAIACDPQRSVVVEACAGAGKTWMLVSRMLRALLAQDAQEQPTCHPQEILAITFTRKAAGEMRERLQQWLLQYARADDQALLQALRERGVGGLDEAAPAARACARLRGLHAQLLASGRSVQIRTFHGWFATLLRSAPVAVLQRLQLPVRHELLEDDSQARSLAWRRFLSSLLDQPDARERFDALVRAHGRSQTDKALQAALDKRIEFERADAAGVLEGSVKTPAQVFSTCAGLGHWSELLKRPGERALLQEAADLLKGLSAPSFAQCGVDLEAALQAQDVDGLFNALLTAQANDRQPRKFGKSGSNEALRQAQTLALELLAMQRQEQAWTYQQQMIVLARLLLEQFKAVKLERGWIDMNDVESAALHLLGDEELAGWMQERLDAQIKHLLIDEFQDTNPLQWHALRAWLQSYAGAARTIGVFIVGDPKQSIYRFRRAEPQVFRSAAEFVRVALGGQVLSCDHTRRNAPQVISAVNAVMADAARSDAYPDFRPHSTDSSQRGQVLRLPVVPRAQAPAAAQPVWRDSLSQPRWEPEERQREAEARQAAAWLLAQLAVRALQPRDVMVLSRKRDSLLPMQQALAAHGVAADIGEKIALIECCEVQDLVALMDVLVSPLHDLSLARVLRSPIFGLDSSALVPLALAARRTGNAWLSLLLAPAGSVPELDDPQASELRPLGARLARWQTWLQSLPPHDALQAIYDDADLLARYAAAAAPLQRDAVLARLRALLAAALGHEGGRYLTAYALVRALKAGLIEAPPSLRSEAVRLLTIHGAKGLEAELVLLLDTDTPQRAAESMGVLVDWPGESQHPQRFVFLLSESRPQACAADLLASDLAEREREELNALYVAMTRARQLLAMSACEPHRDSDRSWWKRLFEQALEVEVSGAAPALAAAVPAPVMLPVLPDLPAVLGAERPERRLAPEPPSASARIGLAMHRLLQWGSTDAPQLRMAAREFGLDALQAQSAREAAERILQGEGAWVWRSADVLWQGNEVELAYAGQLMRLDRLVQHRDGSWWVIDFKSHADPQSQTQLLQQLQTYARAVAALHPGQPVKAAFLTAQGRCFEVDLGAA
ncbi:MAG: UvrD-helicase domain-containing protein [Betaproteobacteria bacterium]